MICLQGVKLATRFESLVDADPRFEVAAKRHLGMVVFRLKASLLRIASRVCTRHGILCLPVAGVWLSNHARRKPMMHIYQRAPTHFCGCKQFVSLKVYLHYRAPAGVHDRLILTSNTEK